MGRRASINAKKRNRRIVTISIVVGIIAAVVILTLVVEAANNNPHSKYIGLPVDANTMSQLTGVSSATLANIGEPPSVTHPNVISGLSLSINGKPEVLYVGGEFCPFCAIERWAMIVALSHFGNFTGLEYMQSSSTDTNPNTPTFTFANSQFTSNYISFVPVEELDRSGATRQALTPDEQNLVTQYDTCPSTGQGGGIPFIDIDNSYAVSCGAQFSLPQIAGQNWTQVAPLLNTASSPVAQEIDGAANTLISAICKVDGSMPSSVCTQSYANVTLASVTTGVVGGQQSLALLPQVRDESRWIG